MNATSVTVWPLRQESAAKTGVLTAVAGLCIVVAAGAGDSPLWALFAVAVLAVSLAPYYVPTTYRPEPDALVIVKPWGRRRIAWSRIGAVKHNRHGLWLLPGGTPSRADAFRQIYIPVKQPAAAGRMADACRGFVASCRQEAPQ